MSITMSRLIQQPAMKRIGGQVLIAIRMLCTRIYFNMHALPFTHVSRIFFFEPCNNNIARQPMYTCIG